MQTNGNSVKRLADRVILQAETRLPYGLTEASASTESKREYQSPTLVDAVAHELNNPLAAAMMQAVLLKESGCDVDSLEYSLQRIQAISAELRLPSRLRSAAGPLQLLEAVSIVQELLGSWASRVEATLPSAAVLLAPLPLCHLLHAVLVSHLDGGSRERVQVHAVTRGARAELAVSGGKPSSRLRISLLAVAQGDSVTSQPALPQLVAQRLAETLGVSCAVSDAAGALQTRLSLPIAIASGVVPATRSKPGSRHRA